MSKIWKIVADTFKANDEVIEIVHEQDLDNVNYEQALKIAESYFNKNKAKYKMYNFEVKLYEVFNDGAEDVVESFDNIGKRGPIINYGIKFAPKVYYEAIGHLIETKRNENGYAISTGLSKKNYMRFETIEQAQDFIEKHDDLKDGIVFRLYH